MDSYAIKCGIREPRNPQRDQELFSKEFLVLDPLPRAGILRFPRCLCPHHQVELP
jgi:hypothetical protein